MSSALGLKNEGDFDPPAQAQTASLEEAAPFQTQSLPFPGVLNVVLMSVVVGTTLVLQTLVTARVDPKSLILFGGIIPVCALLSCYVKLRGTFPDVFRERMQLLLKGIVFIFVALATLRIFNHLTMSVVFPLADPLLDNWDKVLGLDWMAYFTFVQHNFLLNKILHIAYIGFDGASLLGFLALILMGRTARARNFCEIFLITATVSVSIAMFFPAVATVAYYFGDVAHIDGFSSVPGIAHVEQLLALREPSGATVNLLDAEGLAAFPSFHTAGGILLIAGFYKTRWFWLVTLFAVTMIAATPVFGGHYFVDLFAGGALAVAVSVLNARRPCYRGLFGSEKCRH